MTVSKKTVAKATSKVKKVVVDAGKKLLIKEVTKAEAALKLASEKLAAAKKVVEEKKAVLAAAKAKLKG
jgi:hypothetical protein